MHSLYTLRNDLFKLLQEFIDMNPFSDTISASEYDIIIPV